MLGETLGPYRILGKLGEGGMGEVYRAQDVRLKRDVALKVLPQAALDDPSRRGRFEREAQVLASLSHPNIAQVFGIEDFDGAPVIVMELVEGPTLADSLAGGPLPIDVALGTAVQLCDGLEAAHERGIVHRDLKPANIKVPSDGPVKILDFGLARALEDERHVDSSRSPTMIGARTELGVVLGTAAYMSPEQARGRPVDRRADIWAFGCVLYEMLTGAAAFAGETTTDILAAVVHREPDWTRLPADLPPRVGELLRRCLEKNTRDRQRDIADARFEIERARQGTSRQAPAPTTAPPSSERPRPAGRTWAMWLLAGAAAGAALVAVPLRVAPAPEAARTPVRATLALPPDTTLALGRGSAVVLSPDGRLLAFTGHSKGVRRLYVRALDRFDLQPIAGTEGATNPFFSPDGRWLAFFADQKLKKVALDGGAPVVVTDAPNPRGEVWAEAGTIVFTPSNNTAISRVPAAGGTAEPWTTLASGELSHRWPRALPGGALLFTVWNDTGWEPSRIVAERPGSGERSVVVAAGGGYGRYVRDGTASHGFLVYARAEGLLAARFDEARLALTSQAVPVVDGVITNLSGGAHFDLSASGTLAYVPGQLGEAERDLQWVALDGTAAPAVRIRGMSRFWTLSPDGTRVARNNTAGPNRDVWIDDLTRRTSARLTTTGANYNPIWSRDGRWVIFARGIPSTNIFRRAADGSGPEERLTSGPMDQTPSSVSPDGTTLVYSEFDPMSGSDIWVLSLPPPSAEGPADAARGRDARPFVKTTFSEGNAVLSPDGRWLAYQSNESGRFEVYVRSFPDGAQKVQVSTSGGIWPVWAPSGRDLLYRGADARIMAAGVVTAPAIRVDPPRALFDGLGYDNVFAISPDGTRLLMMPLIVAEQSATQVHLVLDFIEELRQRVR